MIISILCTIKKFIMQFEHSYCFNICLSSTFWFEVLNCRSRGPDQRLCPLHWVQTWFTEWSGRSLWSGSRLQLQQTYTEISEVLIVVQSVTHQKGIRHLKTNVWNKYMDTINLSLMKKGTTTYKCSLNGLRLI